MKSVIPSHNGPIVISVNKKEEGYVAPTENARPELNDWIFSNFLHTVAMGSHEISLLQDVINENTIAEIEAIEEVKAVEGKDHTYKVKLNKDRLSAWLNNAYLGQKTDEGSSEADGSSVELEVVLDSEEKYLVSFKTTEDFSITLTNGIKTTTYDNNKIDVKFSNIGDTEILKPAKFLAKDDKELTEEDFVSYYEKCKEWHKKNTGADIYEGE